MGVPALAIPAQVQALELAVGAMLIAKWQGIQVPEMVEAIFPAGEAEDQVPTLTDNLIQVSYPRVLNLPEMEKGKMGFRSWLRGNLLNQKERVSTNHPEILLKKKQPALE